MRIFDVDQSIDLYLGILEQVPGALILVEAQGFLFVGELSKKTPYRAETVPQARDLLSLNVRQGAFDDIKALRCVLAALTESQDRIRGRLSRQSPER